MRYAYPLKRTLFQQDRLQQHLLDIQVSVQGDHRRGIYKKDYIVPFNGFDLISEIQIWLEDFGVNYRLKSYITTERGGWISMKDCYHYIEFNDDQTRLLFKLAWGGK